MTQNKLNWIILLMAIALIGLITFQWYWIDNAITVSEDRFRQGVQAALNAVSDKLEQQEILYTAANKLQFSQEGKTWVGMDSIRFISKTRKGEPGDGKLLSQEEIRRIYFTKDSLTDEQSLLLQAIEADKPHTGSQGVWIDEDVLIEIKKIRSNIDSVVEYNVSKERSINRVEEKTEMVTIVLNELLSRDRKLENRIDQRQLQTLLSSSLKNQGIDTDFDYGVIDGSSQKVVLANEYANHEAVLSSDFRTNLFTRDIIPAGNYLTVYFPRQQTFLLAKIWIPLTSSILLVLAIIGIFGYAIHTILHQKKISEIKSDFINNMTHEFKTPISTVSLACEALQDDDVKKNQSFFNRYIAIIQAENRRLGMQVERVLQMATLEKKDFKLKFEKLNIHEVIERALENIHIQIEKREGNITKHLDAQNSEIMADEVHMTNIVFNLLDNANKYSREKPEITITTKDYNGGILLKIKDKGIGMPREVQSRIFEKFYREPTGNLHDVKGFGLGLAYVKAMLDAHGGTIGVRSEVARGSIFEIFLPQNGKTENSDS